MFFGDRAERHRTIQRGELTDPRSVGRHAPQVSNAIAIGFENNFGTVGAPSTAGLVGRVGGQPLGVSTRRGHRPEIAPPAEADAISVGAQTREAWEINGGLDQGCGQQRRTCLPPWNEEIRHFCGCGSVKDRRGSVASTAVLDVLHAAAAITQTT